MPHGRETQHEFGAGQSRGHRGDFEGGHLRSSKYRSKANPQVVSEATAATRASKAEDRRKSLDACDWTPVTWHLKGTHLTVISLYLDKG